MPPKQSDDQGENPDKLNFSKTQITVIVGSIAAIVVLALALGFLTKKDDAKLEQQTNVEVSPAENATEMPPLPDDAKKEELSKLEGSLPKQVPQATDEAPEQKVPNKAEGEAAKMPEAAPQPAPAVAQPASAAPQKAPAPAAPAPSPGAIIEKTAPKPGAAGIKEKSVKPKKETKAKREKPKKKRVYPRRRKAAEPLHKQVDVKKIHIAPKAEPRKEPKETGEAPIKDGKTGKLENKPGVLSFRTEIKPDTLPPAPVTVEAVAEPKSVEPSAAEPKFTVLAETVAGEDDAKNRVAALKKNGHPAYHLKMVTTKNTWYRVLSGAYATREEADAAAAELGQKEQIPVKVLPYQKP